MSLPTVVYTETQQFAIDEAVRHLSGEKSKTYERVLKIAGPAGSGKTTLIKAVLERVSGVRVCAYCGKAAQVLREKKVEASTIHRLIYHYDEDYDKFYRRDSIPAKGIICDEASQVGEEIFRDLLEYGLPIVAIGDNNQLPPIGDTEISLMDRPHILLDKVHRHGGAILELADLVREGREWRNHKCVKPKSALLGQLDWPDVIICGYNKTRSVLNARLTAGKSGVWPGCKLVVLQNNYSLDVFNGQVIVPYETQTDSYGQHTVWYMADGLSRSLRVSFEVDSRREAHVDYAYAMTCHKMQGSQAKKVAVLYEESNMWDMRRHLYTSVTRASEEVRVYV